MMLSASMRFVSIMLTFAVAASSTSSSTTMSMTMSNMDMSSMSSMSSVTAMGNSTDTSPPYTITALPAVESQNACVFNCLIPIGLADPSGCDDVTENCACLSAPADVLDALTSCVQTVCKSSTSAFGASATSLYESYCNSAYGSASFTAAFTTEAAASSLSNATTTASTTATSSSTNSPTKGSSASYNRPLPSSFLLGTLFAIGLLLIAMF